eukprot:316844_1
MNMILWMIWMMMIIKKIQKMIFMMKLIQNKKDMMINKKMKKLQKKMLQKYIGPLTLEILKYYFSFETITNTICDSTELGNYCLYMLIKDQWKLVRSSITGLVYQIELIQELIISTFSIISRFTNKWHCNSLYNDDYLLEFASLSTLETDVIYDLVQISFETMTINQNIWIANPLLKILNLTQYEINKSRYLQQWFAIKWFIKCAANEAVRQLPFEVKQYSCNGVVFENYEECGINKECIIIDCINMEWNLRNVVVTKQQLINHMKELNEDESIKQDRRPTRMKLENQSFTWLPKWMNILNEMKKLSINKNIKIHISLLKQIITEYKSDEERQAFLTNYEKILDMDCWSF